MEIDTEIRKTTMFIKECATAVCLQSTRSPETLDNEQENNSKEY